MIEDEASLVIERVNTHMISEVNMLRLAVGSLLSKKAGTVYDRQVKDLNVEARLIGEPEAKPKRLLPEGYQEE